ncbi:helix-turn-helix domain-containing protein [Kumtagia ephedrae]|jgi:HTH-type transcriptional regulator/antitoxin HigA|uniref:XRE family transcriptional regulator n=1 Tax=Kumtagia ephedrae TaxID=2116701 RepID=A0A2P7SIY7_9HYPH|nr:XRE family transcriptional regulator [Mesorhizobium ephedrae]PSJ62462.1 XRE family transcriptional regulator [Mesorhizobium ephedrae]
MENIRPIRTEDDYDWAIAEVTRYFENEPAPGTPDADRFVLLTDIIEAYEDKHYPIKAPDPVSLIADYLERTGKKQAALAEIIGSKSRASEIMNRKRALNIAQVHAISAAWKLPADELVKPYHLDGEA